MRLAGIDIGTNTVRLLIAEVGQDGLRPIQDDQRIPRLGEGPPLRPAAIERVLAVLHDFHRQIQSAGVSGVTVAATSAVREAPNGWMFVQRVKDELGLEVEVLSGEQEAERTALGAMVGLGCRTELLIVDIGGGSTELIAVDAMGRLRTVSIPMGVVKLTEQHLAGDPPSEEAQARLREAVRPPLAAALGGLGPLDGYRIVGTAGTVTTLAAMHEGLSHYTPERVHGVQMSRIVVSQLAHRLASLPLDARRAIPVMERGREDVIVAGALLLDELLDLLKVQEITVSDWGLREGIVLAHAARLGGTTPWLHSNPVPPNG